MFPSAPRLIGELAGTLSYGYGDENNLISYNCTFTKEPIESLNDITVSQTPKILKIAAKSQAKSINGRLTSFKITRKNEEKFGIFTITYIIDQQQGRKFAIIQFKHSRFFHWAVQDFPGLSKLDAQSIFNRYSGEFLVE